jgi:DNA-directed RNA polymerase specialized sigma24 family protein
MVIDMNELVEVVNKMVWKECYKKGLKDVNEDVVQEVLLRMWRLIKRNNGEVLETWTGYVWRAVNSVLNNLLRERYERMNVVYLEDMVSEDEEEVDVFLVDKREESFSVKVLRLIERYKDLGEDFLRLIMGDIDVSNALRSITQSRKKGVEWIEWWLGRKLSDEEMRCCEEIKAMLM